MFDRIDSRLPTPLYAQIATAVRGAIASGALTAGSALPSVRALASQLRVNPATVVQAYRDLELQEMIEMRQGAGSFVRDIAPDRRRDEQLAQFRQMLDMVVAEATRLGVSADDVGAMMRDALRGPRA